MAKKKKTASEKYWERRRKLEDKARYKLENEALTEVINILEDAMKDIDIALKAQGDIHNLTYEELLADVSLRDQKKYREYIDKNFEELMNNDKKYQEFIDEFFPEYDYAKVNRLLVIRTQIFNALANNVISNDLNGKLMDDIEKLFKGTYQSNLKVMELITGHTTSTILDPNQLDAILNYPWSGKSFSKKLWGNVSRLEQILSEELLKGFARGDGSREILKAMNERYDNSMRKNMEALVRTEYAHFAEEAIHSGYKETGVESYENLSAEDERVCSICGEQHGKKHKVEDAIPGYNRSPFHTRCRCTDIPVIPDLSDELDALYDEMFGTLLDDFAKNTFGIDLDKYRKNYDIVKVKFTDKIKDGMSDSEIAILEGMLNSAPESVRNLWNTIENDLTTVSSKSKKSYFRDGEGVYFNYQEDSRNSKGIKGKGDFTTFFHEFGHHIDSLFGFTDNQVRSYKSEDLGLSNSLRTEYKMLKKKYNLGVLGGTATLRKYADENYPYGYNGVSDIISGLTDDKYSLGWHHSKKYWKDRRLSDGLGKEAFAHMFAAYTMQNDAHQFMLECFPESYQLVIDFIDKEGG